MKQHNGMRPQDIVVLLKIAALDSLSWRIGDLAHQLCISQSEVSEALHRNRFAGLLDEQNKLHREAVAELLLHGVRYVFPEQPGATAKGMPTAHSAPPLSGMLVPGGEPYVWPDPEGKIRGQSIRPLYRTVPAAARADTKLYEFLALIDTLRVGRTRERKLAEVEIMKRLKAPDAQH